MVALSVLAVLVLAPVIIMWCLLVRAWIAREAREDLAHAEWLATLRRLEERKRRRDSMPTLGAAK